MLEKELQELRESTMQEFAEIDSVDFTSEKKENWAKRNAKMQELVTEIKDAKAIETQKAEIEAELEKGKNVEPMAIHTEPQVDEVEKTIGQQFVESKALAQFNENGIKNVSTELKWNPQAEYKTTLTETGYPPAVTRSALVVPTATLDPLQIPDLIDTITTDQYQYKYLEETTFTNNSGAVAEGSALGENALAFTERTEDIRKIGGFLPVTEETLADVSTLQGYLDSRLRTMVRLAVSDQILGGSGSAPNLTGIQNKSGINTFDFSSYSGNLKRIGQIYQAISEIQKDSFLNPDAILMHPDDFFQLVTEVNAVTTSGALNPLFVGAGNFNAGVNATLWGLPIIQTTEFGSSGTAVVGVFGGGQACHLVARQGMEVAISDSHGENFTKDIIVIKATVRLGFPIYRASAFCTITNL